MTTPGFGARSSAIAQAQAVIRQQHCPPPSYCPSQQVKASMRCMKCGGLLTYEVSPINARTSGHRSTSGCIRWND